MNILYNNIRKDKQIIKDFIKNNKYDIIIHQCSNNESHDINKRIISYSDVKWVNKTSVIKDMNNLHAIYIITWGKNTITIKTTESEFKNIKLRLKIIIGMIEYLSSISTVQTTELDIYLVLTSLKKYFPDKGLIDVNHVNSGYTDFRQNIIFIWRLEEFEKVLFHELMHFYNMDTRHHDYDMLVDIHNDTECYYEAITDFLGIYYYLIFLSLQTKTSIKLLLQLELGFIKNQAIQINDYLNLGDWVGKPLKKIKQNTASFSYYILKYLLFEYAQSNNIDDEIKDGNKLLKKIIKIGFKTEQVIKIKSSRMTMLQLK